MSGTATHPLPLFETLEDRRLFSVVTHTVFAASGTAKAAWELQRFERAIGGANNAMLGPQQTGFRTINWDGVTLDGTDFNHHSQVVVPNKIVGIPVNRFQARGVFFEEVYGVSGDGFVSANHGVANQFHAFSPSNTFAMFNETSIDLRFVRPSAPTTSPANRGTRGFGAIFLDVERPHTSYIEYFHNNTSLGRFYVPVGRNGQAEFLGVLFNNPQVTRVSIHPGTATVFSFHNNHVQSGPADISNGGSQDMVVTDDFVYAEPSPT